MSPTTKIITKINNLNYANWNGQAQWGGVNGNITTVGTNGGPSYYGLYDTSGLISQWNDLNSNATDKKVLKAWGWSSSGQFIGNQILVQVAPDLSTIPVAVGLSKFGRGEVLAGSFPQTPANQGPNIGFRICSNNNFLNLDNFVTVTNINNASDTNGYGSVSYQYMISKFAITVKDYLEFLSSVGTTDTYGIYNSQMNTSLRRSISRLGSQGSYTYQYSLNIMSNKPITSVTWFNAARYCNWLHNGKPTGPQNNTTTEDGAYTLNGAITGIAPSKNINAKYWIPNENEWYKASYYTPNKNGTGPGYWLYGTQSDNIPTAITATGSGDGIIPLTDAQPKIKGISVIYK